jgi:hypothetical protein
VGSGEPPARRGAACGPGRRPAAAPGRRDASVAPIGSRLAGVLERRRGPDRKQA